MTKKIIASLLALVLLAAVFVSCKKPSDGPSEGSTNVVPDDGLLHPSVPEGKTFNGSTFRVAGFDPGLYPSTVIDFDFEVDQSEKVAASIFRRNRLIEDRYKVDFKYEYIPMEDSTPTLNSLVDAGEDYYQLIMLISREAWPAALDDYILLPDDIPYFDPTQPWYMSKINDSLSIKNKYILAYTDESMNTYLQSVCVFFNQQFVEDRDSITSPYDLIDEGKWTFDKFYEMCEDVIEDVDHDGSLSALTGDIFGVDSENDMFWPSTWIGSDARTIVKDEEDIPKFVGGSSQKLIDVLEKLNEKLKIEGLYCNNEDFFGSVNDNGDASRDSGTEYFANGGALFRIGTVGNIQLLRGMNSDFGVVPLPAYDEKQTEYYSRAIDGWLHVAPTTVVDKDLVGAMIDILGCESRNYVIPAFFDDALDNKYVREKGREQTLKNLETIFNNITMDLGDTIWLMYVRGPINEVIGGGKGGFSSRMKSLSMIVENGCIGAVTDFIDEHF